MRLIIAIILYGSIICSDSQAQWIVEKNLMFTNTLFYDLSVVDTGVAWISGQVGYLPPDTPCIYRRTPTLGWKPVPVYDLDQNIQYCCIAGLDSMKAYLGTVDGRVYYTKNAGNNWSLIFDFTGIAYIDDIRFAKNYPNIGYIFSDPPGGYGHPFKICKTTNSGTSWNVLSPSFGGVYLGSYKSACVLDSNHVWFGLNCQFISCHVPRLAYTSNGGITWGESILPGYNDLINASEFDENLHGLASTWSFNSYMYNTSNGGMSWNYSLQDSFIVMCIKHVPESSVWYYNNLNRFFKSTNNGINWNRMNSDTTDQIWTLDVTRKANLIYAWAITVNGMILKLIDTVTTIGINPKEENIPKEFALMQNYPNPFNPTTVISYALPKASEVKLVVYDLLGREVRTLVNEFKQAGTYEVSFDASSLASGVYFYRINAGSFTDVKKMMVIK